MFFILRVVTDYINTDITKIVLLDWKKDKTLLGCSALLMPLDGVLKPKSHNDCCNYGMFSTAIHPPIHPFIFC